jgi:hypothetical protein
MCGMVRGEKPLPSHSGPSNTKKKKKKKNRIVVKVVGEDVTTEKTDEDRTITYRDGV